MQGKHIRLYWSTKAKLEQMNYQTVPECERTCEEEVIVGFLRLITNELSSSHDIHRIYPLSTHTKSTTRFVLLVGDALHANEKSSITMLSMFCSLQIEFISQNNIDADLV